MDEPPQSSFLSINLGPTQRKPRQIFVAYPYSIPKRDYRRVYTDLAAAFSVTFVFADEKLTGLHVLQKIYTMIRESAFGIYDISGWNPNVTLDLGLAYGMGALAFLVVNPQLHTSGDAPICAVWTAFATRPTPSWETP
jgi:hypothetical protein